VALTLIAACDGRQSSLTPAGPDAERVFDLFVVMSVGSAIVWLAVVGLSLYATRLRPREHPRLGHRLIIGGGAVAPALVLGALLIYGLAPLPAMLALPAPGGPVIVVTGEQWWWRVRYDLPGGRSFDTANELRLPVNERIEVQLQSADVIHSFWLPSITGKMDVIPGRLNRIALEPSRTGVFRGACAEYCGRSHARMNFETVVLSRPDFDAWVEEQLRDASPASSGPVATSEMAEQGETRFLASGCGACHTIRGTAAAGRLGPDLTHVGSRLTIGAGMLPLRVGELQRWIELTEHVKPGVRMPSFNMIPPEDVRAISTYLAGLR
jgi:cytochrome c oxidase subunit 2